MLEIPSIKLQKIAKNCSEALFPSSQEKSIERLKSVVFGNSIFHTLSNKQLEKERVEAKSTSFYAKGGYSFLSSIKYLTMCSIFSLPVKKFIIGSSLDKRINNFQPLIYSTTSFIRINDGLKELIYPICNLLPKSISTYVMIAIAEEVIFRFTFQRGLHYLQESLKEKIPEGYGKDSYLLSPSFRCLTTSLVFGFAHILNHKADKRTTALPQCLIIILFANAMSIQYETYDSLACPILSHFLFNFFVFNCSKIPHIDRILVSLFFAYTTGLAISSFIPDKKNVGNAITSNSSFETPD